MANLMTFDKELGRTSTNRKARVYGKIVTVSHRNPATGEYYVLEREDGGLLGNPWVKPELVYFCLKD